MIPILPILAFASLTAITNFELRNEIPLAALKAPPAAALLGIEAGDRAVIGVVASPVDELLASHLGLEANQGVVLMQVFDGQPAATAGFRRYDVLLTLDGQPVASHDDVRKVLDGKKPGDPVRATGRRGPNEIDCVVTLGAGAAENDPFTNALSRLHASGDADPARIALLNELFAVQKARTDDERRAATEALSGLSRIDPKSADERRALEELLAMQQAQLSKQHADLAVAREKLEADLRQLNAQQDLPKVEVERAVADLKAQIEMVRNYPEFELAKRDHMTALQDALASQVDRLDAAKQELASRAEDLKAKVANEFLARAEELRDKLGAEGMDKLAAESNRIAEEVRESVLDAREQLEALHRGAGDSLRRRAESIEAQGRALVEEQTRAIAEELKRARSQQHGSDGAIEGRLTSIEERLARIEDLLGKLVKRDSQN